MRIQHLALAAILAAAFSTIAGAADKKAAKPERFTGPAGKVYTYKETPQGKLDIEVYFPPDWKASDKRPAVVFFFGGGWTSGNRSQFYVYSDYLAKRGMVAATADYRIKSKHNTSPAESVEDAKSAVRWMRAHATELGVDPEKLASGGGSAGGHLAAATSLCEGFEVTSEDQKISSKPNAMLLYNPVFDLTQGEAARVAAPADKPGDATARLKAISPIFGVNAKAPPAIMFYGTEDKLNTNGTAYLAKSTDGNRAELYTAEGQAHGFFNRQPWQNICLRKTDEFLVSIGYLKGEPTVSADQEHSLKRVMK